MYNLLRNMYFDCYKLIIKQLFFNIYFNELFIY